MSIRALYIGEIVGKAGVFAVKTMLPSLRASYKPDLVIANASGATGGSGVGKAHALYLRKLGIDILTTGEAAFYKKDIVDVFPRSPWLLRPLNHPPGVPGSGLRIHQTSKGPVAVAQLLGQSGFGRIHLDNPFHALDALLDELSPRKLPLLLDFRAGTTAEKNAMFHYADGRVAAVIGSHSRTLTADSCIGPGGTAYITDAGMTGAMLSVAGMDAHSKIGEYISGIPSWGKEAIKEAEFQGCLVELGDDGKARSIEALRFPCREEFHERTGDSH